MAGLIPQAFIDDLLHRTDIVETVDKRVSLKKSGRNFTACCPFHQEKTPSFSVNQERQFFYCFGCGEGGNAIGFVMKFDGLDFPEAVESLARDAGVEVPREESKAEARKHSENAKMLAVLERASRFYQCQLRQHEDKQPAVDYLLGRGVSGKIAAEFGLGYAPPGWDKLLQAIGEDEAQRELLFRAGMTIQKERDAEQGSPSSADVRYYDRFRHRIMFPIRDSRGRTIAFGGRVLGDDKPKYLNSPETPVFHKGSELYGLYEAKRSQEKFSRLLLVEGYMDVIALAQMGIRNAVATLGTATSGRHLTRLFRQVPEVVFCFDGDQAGRKAAWRALETTLPLMEDGRQVRFLFLPEGSDPDSRVREVGKESFLSEVDAAAPLERYFFDHLSEDLAIDTIEGKARLGKLAKPLLAKLPRGVFAQLMLDRLSDLLGINSESLDRLLETEATPEPPEPPPAGMPDRPLPPAIRRNAAAGRQKVYRKPASIKAIELLLRNPEMALTIKQDLSPLHGDEDEARKLLLALIEMVQNDPNTETFTLLGYCYGSSLDGQLTQLINGEKITPQEGIEDEFHHLLDNILSNIVRKRESLQLKNELKSRVSAVKSSES